MCGPPVEPTTIAVWTNRLRWHQPVESDINDKIYKTTKNKICNLRKSFSGTHNHNHCSLSQPALVTPTGRKWQQWSNFWFYKTTKNFIMQQNINVQQKVIRQNLFKLSMVLKATTIAVWHQWHKCGGYNSVTLWHTHDMLCGFQFIFNERTVSVTKMSLWEKSFL